MILFFHLASEDAQDHLTEKQHHIKNKPNLRLYSVPDLHQCWNLVFLSQIVFRFYCLVFLLSQQQYVL